MPTQNNPWLEASDVIPMFPTLVWQLQIKAELCAAMNAKMHAALQSMRHDALLPGQGWQSGQALHRREEFQDLAGCINHATQGIQRFLKIGCDAFEITACWATVLAQGATHKIHSHPNNFLSGVYYLHVPSGADVINFHDPRSQAAIIRPPVTALTAENTDQVVVRVRSGTLLVFPSYLQHSVDANPSVEERISVSFNIMFSDFTEQLSKPLW